MPSDFNPHTPNTIPAEQPEFSRKIAVRKCPRNGLDFDERATEQECTDLARLLDANIVARARIRGTIRPHGKTGWKVTATVLATVEQSCVLTLTPVITKLSEPVTRIYEPMDETGTDIIISESMDEDIEPLTDEIDLGLITTEVIALSLPAYPKTAEAHLDPAFSTLPDAPQEQPFAKLAELRKKMSSDD